MLAPLLLFLYLGLPALIYALRMLLPIEYVLPIAIGAIMLRMYIVIMVMVRQLAQGYGSSQLWHIGSREIAWAAIYATILIGIALSSATIANSWFSGWFKGDSPIQLFAFSLQYRIAGLLALVLVAYDEELFYRGWGFQYMQKYSITGWSAIALSAVCFAISHIPYGATATMNALIGGLLLSYGYYQYQRIHAIALAHGLANVGAALLRWFGSYGAV